MLPGVWLASGLLWPGLAATPLAPPGGLMNAPTFASMRHFPSLLSRRLKRRLKRQYRREYSGFGSKLSLADIGEEVRCAEPFFAVLAALGKTDLFRTHEVPRIKAVLGTLGAF